MNARSDRLLNSMRDELLEVKRQLNHYARLTTSLELQLETLDRQQKRTYRRAEELVAAIELEQLRLDHAERIGPVRARVAV